MSAAPWPPQCPLDGCAARLLKLLRANGCRLRAEFGRPDGMLWMIETPTLLSAVVADAYAAGTRTHEVRLLMLLWAEAGGFRCAGGFQ